MTKHLLIFLMLSLIAMTGRSQQTPDWTLNVEEVEQYKAQSRALVSYFEGTLNFLGDPRSTTQEKEVVIEESYSKIFADAEVQIEDDLDDQREVPINKDVQAYLKDIDFFFQSAVFSFDIQAVDPLMNENGVMYFRVTFMRRLDAVTIGGDSLSNTKLRFMEINLDPFKKDLKIASYYTTKINEQEELRQWWSSLPGYWRDIFGKDAAVYDSLLLADIEGIGDDAIVVSRKFIEHRQGTYFVAGDDTIPARDSAMLFNRRPDTILILDDFRRYWAPDSIKVNLAVVDNRLKQISGIKTLDLSFNPLLVSLEPLSQLTALEDLNISNTPVNDITPLRNLSKINTLSLSSTLVTDLSPLQYLSNIRELYLHETAINDISVLAHLRNLEKLFAFNTAIRDISALEKLSKMTVLRAGHTNIEQLDAIKNLTELKILEVNQTPISSLNPVAGLIHLQQLNIDQTNVADLSPLSNMNELNLLQLNETKVSDLAPLENLKNLTRVYANKTGIEPAQATGMMRKKPGLLVVFNTEELEQWWYKLPIYWRALLTEQAGINSQPTAEDLHQIINISLLDLSGNTYLPDLLPLERLVNLRELSVSKTEITDLSPLKDLHNLQKINLSNTRIANLEPLSGLFQLEELNIESSRVESLAPLLGLKTLQLVKADNSRISSSTVMELLAAIPTIRIIYQTEKLRFWWDNLSDEWHSILFQGMVEKATPDAILLQTIADRQEVVIENNLNISNLEPLMPLLMLKKLVLKGTAVNDLTPLGSLSQLEYLDLPGNPFTKLDPLSNLKNLRYLNIESTPVTELNALSTLTNLRQLNVSGTQIKALKPLAQLNQLNELSIYNTRLRSLSPADKLPELRHLKCYNTRISRKAIDKLKAERPEINILYY